MNMIHGHEVLQMIQAGHYSEAELLDAIKEKFGADARFYTCHSQDLTAEQLLAFFKERGKVIFTPSGSDIDPDKVCSNLH